MTRPKKIIEAEEIKPKTTGNRQGDGGTFLVVADETEEFPVALRYAIKRARYNRGHVGILHIIDIDEFQHWGTVEKVMRKELREKAEKFIWTIAKSIGGTNNEMPSLYIEEGSRYDTLVDVINRDPFIVQLILGGGVSSSGPGPLVSYFTGKGLSRLNVPIVIVPGHLEEKRADLLR